MTIGAGIELDQAELTERIALELHDESRARLRVARQTYRRVVRASIPAPPPLDDLTLADLRVLAVAVLSEVLDADVALGAAVTDRRRIDAAWAAVRAEDMLDAVIDRLDLHLSDARACQP